MSGRLACLLGGLCGAALFAAGAHAEVFTSVAIPANNDIQTNLISTFPTGTFTANNSLATPFQIPASSTSSCGTGGVCNFNDAFGFNGSGSAITLNVSIPNVTDVYTLMNAYDPAGGQTLATVTFIGSGGASQTFDLVGGAVIRDFFQGSFTNSLSNGIPGITAENAFTCSDPSTCLGAGGSGDVNTGLQGTYVIDEQDFTLDPAFATQTLTQIVITDTFNGSDPILLGVTAGAASPATVPEPATFALLGMGLIGLGAVRRRKGA